MIVDMHLKPEGIAVILADATPDEQAMVMLEFAKRLKVTDCAKLLDRLAFNGTKQDAQALSVLGAVFVKHFKRLA